MWDAGIGSCVVCGTESDRDILGRCDGCFRAGVSVQGAYFKASAENPYYAKMSKAHDADIGDRRWHPTEKRMFYYSKEQPKTYYFPKG
jgi:hypothetical protein